MRNPCYKGHSVDFKIAIKSYPICRQADKFHFTRKFSLPYISKERRKQKKKRPCPTLLVFKVKTREEESKPWKSCVRNSFATCSIWKPFFLSFIQTRIVIILFKKNKFIICACVYNGIQLKPVFAIAPIFSILIRRHTELVSLFHTKQCKCSFYIRKKQLRCPTFVKVGNSKKECEKNAIHTK